MKLKAKRPPAATGGAPKSFACLGAWNGSESNAAAFDLQQLRAHFLARRFAISPDMATLLATLALGEVRA
jgi:hypothetical protein